MRHLIVLSALPLLLACESTHGPVPEELVQPLFRLFYECETPLGQNLVESDLPDGPEVGLHTNAMSRFGFDAFTGGTWRINFENGIEIEGTWDDVRIAEANHILGGTVTWGPPEARRIACIASPGSAFHALGYQAAAILRISGGGADCSEALSGTIRVCGVIKESR